MNKRVSILAVTEQRRTLSLLATTLLLFFAIPATADDSMFARCDLGDYQPSMRPNPPGAPTEITLGLALADLIAINDIDQTVTMNVLLTTAWTDRRLSEVSGCRYPYSRVWTPALQLINSGTCAPRQPPELVVQEDGEIVSAVRFECTIANPWHMREFPFDVNNIAVRVVSLEYSAAELPLRISKTWTGRVDMLTIPDWKIGEPVVSLSETMMPRLGKVVSVFEFQIPAARRADYYIYKFVLPLCMIVMMSWLVFWIEASELESQLALAATSMLTLIAFQFAMNDLLPKVGYLTKMDQYVLASSVLVFLALLEALVTSRQASQGKTKAADRLDRTCRWLFPGTYLIVILATLVF